MSFGIALAGGLLVAVLRLMLTAAGYALRLAAWASKAALRALAAGSEGLGRLAAKGYRAARRRQEEKAGNR